jgi:5-(carboxyamino)imidazole ribonucleotide synthase
MSVLLPGATLGVMGGGQLGRMFVHAAQRMGYFTAVLDPDQSSPAGRVSHHHVRADYLDEIGLAKLSGHSDAITTEFENVPAGALARLAEHRPVAPGAAAVAIAQDRAEEKAHFRRCGVACAPYAVITGEQELAAVGDDLLPGILKTSRLGYDGKGQARVATRAELRVAWESLQRADCVLEKMLPLAFECSVVVARGRDGAMVHLPAQRNLHRDGILAVTEVHEACIPAAQARRAIEAARAIAEGLHYVGVLCVEFFGLEDGSLVVNEMAPRPHNSGHWSIEGAVTSQFEQHLRAVLDLPLGDTTPLAPVSVMVNVLGGPAGATMPDRYPAALAAHPDVKFHSYGKASRQGRKVGHVTATGTDLPEVLGRARAAAAFFEG